MEIFYKPQKKTDLSVALGFFDGIHLGHKKVIQNAVDYAKKNKLKSAVISFQDNPSCFILNRNPEYIISREDKINIIESLGVDYLYLLDFNKSLSDMSKEEYFKFLLEYTSPKSITTGFNHFFGKNKQGNTEFLKNECKKNNIIYTKIPSVKAGSQIISSSLIRKSLLNADLTNVKNMTGYDFYIKGKVIQGNHIGSKLGYKTINVNYPDNIIKLPYGVYLTKTIIDEKSYNSVTNWGIKPTINKKNEPVIETHILNFENNIYDKSVKIVFLKKIRDEQKFDTLNDLHTQIEKDIEFVVTCFKN